MARGTTKKKEPVASNELLSALKFVALAQHTEGEGYKQHCRLSRNMATAFDGVLACGHPIVDGLDAQPHTATFVKALAKCKEHLSITHVDEMILVASGGFKVRIPCDPVPNSVAAADPPAIGVTEAFAHALSLVVKLPEDGADSFMARTVFVNNTSVVACHRGHVLIEAWHGLALGCVAPLPVRSVKAVLAAGKPIVALGWSDRSVTFHYGDGSWIKTQREEGTWFEYERLLNVGATMEALPVNLLDGLKFLKDFSEDGRVRFVDGGLQTSDSDKIGASFECIGLRAPGTFKIEYLLHLRELAAEADLYHAKGCLFNGQSEGVYVRGLIARMVS